MANTFKIERKEHYFLVEFTAMASPCQLLLAEPDEDLVYQLAEKATAECWRIEQKYSRYLRDNLMWRLNHANGEKQPIDHETWQLLSYAGQLFLLSDGLFDISAGVLRKLWQFDQKTYRLPAKKALNALLDKVGFEKLEFTEKYFRMPSEMEIDLGGIGKEYATDKLANIIGEALHQRGANFLVNLGGDMMAMDFDHDKTSWRVGIESVRVSAEKSRMPEADKLLELRQGGLATSGSTKRFLYVRNAQDELIKMGHILNPQTGYPVSDAPLSVSVVAETCTLAGSMSTLAMLQGKNAESWLAEQQLQYWVYR